ncbi:MAG: AAA family ATPase, partial [Candidatus Hydrogenedentes bacterium]|nr:AAA family ATPase [Candidatus Hydrogenedentota bacterium]
DASKCMFEDILGFPNIHKLQQGIVEYVPSPVTVWDKELILIDELNRALPETQSRWLELIRSRRIMGFPTRVKWVWAAMNPLSYSATQVLDDALIGRFAFFLYPPDVLQMEEEDRIRVATHINGDDAPSLSEWTGGVSAGTVAASDIEAVAQALRTMLTAAGQHFLQLRAQFGTLPEFLAKFCDLLVRESKGEVALDGRRLGFIHRNLLANRAIELAKTQVFNNPLPDFVASSRYVVQSSIPVGLNDASLQRDEAVHHMEICFDLLSRYFEEGAELTTVNRIYELFTTPNPMRKAELLLTCNLGEFALSKAWTDLMARDQDISLLAYTALQVDARRPGTVPPELLASLSAKVGPENLSTKCVPRLEDAAIEYVEEVEELLDQPTDLAKLIAYQRVKELVASGNLNETTLRETGRGIEQDIQAFESMLAGNAPARKGGVAA